MKSSAVMVGVSVALSLRAAMAGQDLSQHLKDLAVVWLDANINLIQDAEGGVREWRDVREADVSGVPSYPRALAYCPDPETVYSAKLPVVYGDADGRFAGKKLVDFGEYFSGRWLYFSDKDRAIVQVPVGAFAGVVGFHDKSYGFLLGDVSSLSGGGGKSFFGKSADGQADTYIAKSTSLFCQGETRIDGEIVDPSKTKYSAFQVFSQNGPSFVDDVGKYGRPYVSTLFNDRNYKKSGGYQDRQGGGIVGELLIFSRPLAAAERRMVDEYLSQKWFGKTCGGVSSATETMTRLDPSTLAGATVYVTNGVSVLSPAPSAGAPVPDPFLSPDFNIASDFGDVTVPYDVESNLVKTTTKTFNVPQDGIYRVSMTISRDVEGDEEDGKLVAEFNLDGQTAKYYHAVQDDVRGGRDIPKTYTFTLPFLKAGSHRLNFSMRRAVSTAYRAYTASDICISLVKAGEFVPIMDAGFDSVMDRIYAAANAWYSRNPSDTPWSYKAGSTSCGITLYSSYWWWEAGFDGESLEDMRRCFLTIKNFTGDTVSQTLNVPRSGRVRLSFRYANRGNSGNASSATARRTGHSVSVSVGGVNVAAVYPMTQQNRTCSAEFDINEGPQELKVSLDAPTADEYVAIVDDFRIEYVDGVQPKGRSEYALAAESDGWYRLVIDAAGPVVDRSSTTNCIAGNPARSAIQVSISVDGVPTGSFTVNSDEFFAYAFTLPRLLKGEHFVDIANNGELRLRVRSVALTAIPDSDLITLGKEAVAKTTFVVKEPGMLHLDYLGVLGGCYLKMDGVKVSGVHSALTDGGRLCGTGALDSAVKGLVLSVR